MWRVVRNERGTSSVEFLLIAPFLLFILFGSVELSRAWFTMNLMTTAACDAVRGWWPPDQRDGRWQARRSQMLIHEQSKRNSKPLQVGEPLARYGTQNLAAKHLGVGQATIARNAEEYRLGA